MQIYTTPSTLRAVMSDYYVSMVEKFEVWACDASELLHGKDALFADESLLHSDDIMEALMKDHPDDDIVTECLQLTMKTFEALARRLLQDHLPGGKYHNTEKTLQMETAPVPTTNTISERDFGKFDRLLRGQEMRRKQYLKQHGRWLPLTGNCLNRG